jgi:Uma2 family endonuclease
MNPIAPPMTLPPAPDAPSFEYGYRLRHITRSDGTQGIEQVPLSREDLLHPEFGDKPMDGQVHAEIREYLASVFRARTHDDRSAVVLSDVGVYWHHPEFSHHSPDISVIFGVRETGRTFNTFDVVEQGVRPTLIIEIVSPRYRENDVDAKYEQYHKARVPLYVIIDRDTYDGPVRLLGYQRNPKRYVPILPDDDGRLWLEPVGVWLAAKGNRVVCFDENDQELGDYATVSGQLRETSRRADDAERRAEDAARRADEEARARAAAEERVKQLEEQLRLRNANA